MHTFRVLVIDDDPEVMRRVSERVRTEKRTFERDSWQVEISQIHVRLEKDAATNQYCFTPGVFDDLAQKCSLKPDLMIVDYGYADVAVLDYWRQRDKEGHTVTEADMKGQFLTIVDLVKAVQEIVADDKIDSSIRRNLSRNFLMFDKKLILYTMTSRAFMAALGETETRRRKTQSAFRVAAVSVVDTNYEFYNRDEFVASKHDPRFYAHLVSGWIDNLVQVGLLERMLEHARSLKYLRAGRSMFSVGAIVAVGGGIAAVSEFLGARLFGFLDRGDFANALIVAGFGVVVIFCAGIALPFAFGSFMTGLLGTRSDRNSEG